MSSFYPKLSVASFLRNFSGASQGFSTCGVFTLTSGPRFRFRSFRFNECLNIMFVPNSASTLSWFWNVLFQGMSSKYAELPGVYLSKYLPFQWIYSVEENHCPFTTENLVSLPLSLSFFLSGGEGRRVEGRVQIVHLLCLLSHCYKDEVPCRSFWRQWVI